MAAAVAPEALIALLSLHEPVDVDEHLAAMSLPRLLYGGEEDRLDAGVKECARRLPQVTVITLPGLDHIEARYRPHLVVPHMRRSLAEAGRA